MDKAALLALADRVEAMHGNGKMRFSLLSGIGWISTRSEDAIRTLCDVYNNRATVAAALRAIAGGEDA